MAVTTRGKQVIQASLISESLRYDETQENKSQIKWK